MRGNWFMVIVYAKASLLTHHLLKQWFVIEFVTAREPHMERIQLHMSY